LELTGLQSDVVLVGAGDRLEIRDRAAWAASKSDRLNKLPELMRRITARKGPAKP
jgi:DNA-binding transcriptional regulator/RsmH inhibitor MraZ